jgi:hypothetical protein
MIVGESPAGSAWTTGHRTKVRDSVSSTNMATAFSSGPDTFGGVMTVARVRS